MKKRYLLALLAVLMAMALAGCSSGNGAATQTSADATLPAQNSDSAASAGDLYVYPSPDETSASEEGADEQPTLPPEETLPPDSVAPDASAPAQSDASAQGTASPAAMSTYAATNYSVVTSESLALSMQYPTGWVNLPGRYTICYQQPQESGKFSARAAVTVKSVKHTPEKLDDIKDEFKSYMLGLASMFNTDDFTIGELDTQAVFLGQQAYASTYVTMSGDIEVKGYCVITYVGRKLCVYHFCSAYDDYAAMEPIRVAIRDSIRYSTQ